MFLVRVMPVARGIFKDELTFFSRDMVPAGNAIEATVRGRKIPALVIESRDAREGKAELRSADFTLKKLDSEKPSRRIFAEYFMDAVRETALWHGVHEGIAAASLTSHTILSSLPLLEEVRTRSEDAKRALKADLLVLQAEREERVRTYRNLAREAFARGSSVVIVAPTVVEAEMLSEELSRGIENRIVLLAGDMAKKRLVGAWNRAVAESEPIVIVGTALVLSHPRHDVDTVIIERESAKSYRGRERPYLDVRRAAEYISHASGARLILADFPLRAETRHRVREEEAGELSRLQVRPAGTATVVIHDSRPEDEKRGEKRVFTTLAKETKEAIGREMKKGGRAAVFAARKGLAPLTVCNDCGTPVTDALSGAPMVLHKTGKGNVFVSHRSGAILPAETSCKNCGSWNLVTLGIGVDRVEEELAAAFPDTRVFTFTKDTTPTHAKAKKLSQEFFGTKSAIVVGTERMLPYLSDPVEIGVVASIDSMLSLPAWRANEQTLSILYYLRERSENRFIIETRQPDHAVMRAVESGNPADFYRTEIDEREKYSYPPFSIFVGLTAVGGQESVEELRTLITELFQTEDLVGPLPAEQVTRSEWRAKAVIRIKKGAWPDLLLYEKLKSLPPSILVAVDPDEIV